jgi:uncharacterized protein (DUF58 family)
VTLALSPRVAGYAGLAALGLVSALALRRPELAALAAPFGLLAAAGLAGTAPRLTAGFELDAERVVEGDTVGATLMVESEGQGCRADVVLPLPAGVTALDPAARTVLLGRQRRRELRLRLRCDRWGAHRLGEVRLRSHGRLGLQTWEGRVPLDASLVVLPTAPRLRELVPPRRTHAFAGAQLARAKGDGFEFADLRPFHAGDRRRAINWRASARRGSLVVNERVPERSSDVVVLLDGFAEASAAGGSTLDLAVRATAALVDRYLDRRDRVGLVTLGGSLRWLQPGGGEVQRYRLVEALLQAGIELTYAWRGVSILPPRVLPAHALVLAVTPLLDDRLLDVVLGLRGRGHDVAVLEVAAEPFVAAGPRPLDGLAHRLWLLRRDAMRGRLLRAGVAVGRWDGTDALDVPVEEVRSFRRAASLSPR